MCLPLLAAVPAVMGAIGAGVGVTGAGVTAGMSIAAGTAITAGVVGAGVSAYGQYQQGVAQKKMYDYQQKSQELQANYDLKIGQAQAEADETTGSLQMKQLVQNQAELEGSQRAAEGAAGTAGSVNAENIATSTFTKQQLDQQMLRYNTDIKAWSATESAKGAAWNARTQAEQYGIAGKNARTAGELSATGTILGEATSVASTAVRLK